MLQSVGLQRVGPNLATEQQVKKGKKERKKEKKERKKTAQHRTKIKNFRVNLNQVQILDLLLPLTIAFGTIAVLVFLNPSSSSVNQE